MKYAPTLALLALCLMVADNAFAQRRMQDFSMSPEESMRHANTPSSAPSNNNSQPFFDQQQQQGAQPGGGLRNFNYRHGSSNYNTQLPGQPSSQFMPAFCDPNFKPMLSSGGRIASLNACIDAQKQQACDLFARLPKDAQPVMDEMIACLYNAANEGEMDEQGYIRQLPASQDCSRGDTQRMNLLKRYWNDQNAAYAIVFLPELVLEAPGRCMGGN